MKIKNIGLDISKDELIKKTYRTYIGKEKAKFNENTNLKTGHICFEDGVFLPEGSYVLIKEDGKKDKIGRIFYYETIFQDRLDQYYSVAIVNIFYDMTSGKNRTQLNENFIIDFINKNIYLDSDKNKYKNKYLQLISYEEEDDDKWEFVRVEYGNPNVKMFYMYGYQHYDGCIYEKKDIKSEILSCFKHYNYIINVYKDVEKIDKITNIEYKIKPNILFAPDELELFIIYIIGMCVSFIFKDFIALWIILTIVFFIKRKQIRNKYNL